MGLGPQELPVPVNRPFQTRYSGRFAAQGQVRATVAYYAGCATNTLYPETGAHVIGVFTRNGIEVIVPDGLACCGLPALIEGDLDTARELIQNNINILGGHRVEAIITDCTSCGMMFKNWATKVLDKDDPFLSQVESAAEKTWEATSYLNDRGLVVEPAPIAREYTYHVPCHRGWEESVREAPRSLLAQVPEARLVEMREPERCCGAGGAFFLENKELSGNIRSHKLEDIDRTGVPVVITQCPACRLYLDVRPGDRMVMHPLSFLAGGYELAEQSGLRILAQ